MTGTIARVRPFWVTPLNTSALIEHSALGAKAHLRYAFGQDALAYVSVPAPAMPLTSLHGRRDEVVPVAHGRDYASAHADMTLIGTDGDHPTYLELIWLPTQKNLVWVVGPYRPLVGFGCAQSRA